MTHDKDHVQWLPIEIPGARTSERVKLGSMLASIAREVGGLTDAEVEHFKQLRKNNFSLSQPPGEPSMNNEDWIAHAYPLQQVTIKLQGTRHSDKTAVIGQLETVLARLKAGDSAGHDHDDDFGYAFEYVAASPGPSFFDAPAGSK